MKYKKGITLIVLVITIVVLLILTTVTITSLTGDRGLFSKATEAGFKNKMAKYREETNLYVSSVIAETLDTDTSSINSGKELIELVKLEQISDIKEEDINIPLKSIIDINNDDDKFIVVYKGELCYVSSDKIADNDKKTKWCKEIGIKILEGGKAPEGIEVKNGKYELVRDMYICTPKLDEGLNPNKTRFLNVVTKNETKYLTPGNWITGKADDSWYDYTAGNWANIVIDNEGAESYYVWIPRYCFKLDSASQTSDVKFIDVYNVYKDKDGKETKVGEGILKGYQVPDAFTFNNVNLAGFWVMKYTAGNVTSPSKLDFDMTVSKGKISLKNITKNISDAVSKYTLALNGTIINDKITDISKPIVIENPKAGNNYINLTALNDNGEIVATMTKEYEPAVVNKPDITKLNQDTTFYVMYDEKGNEHSIVPVNKEAPKGWYDYGAGEWANIVTRNNGLETYYTWIPRYCFRLDQNNQKSTIKFLTGTSSDIPSGYQIPEAFTFNGVPLTGFWVMKYTAGGEYASKFDSDITAYGNKIKTKGISGTSVNTGQKYNYYINGTLKGSTTNASDIFEFTNLNENTLYTINIEIRTNDANDTYLGSITKQVKTIMPNEPNFKGFALDKAKYILYDDTGTNETVGDIIKYDVDGKPTNMPDNWYDYASNKWANILIEANGKKTYYTWIPRYCFRLDQTNQKSIIEFLRGTSQDVPSGYQIPEAFTFNKVPLTGFWVMKYTAGN